MEYKKWISSAAVLLLALLSLVKEGMGITCYMCNSERNKRMCEHLEGDVSALEQDCDKLATAGRRNVTYTVCRKMYQLIYNGGDKEIERVIRQCGTGGSLGCMKKTKPNSLQVETCHCTEDLCNAAPPYASSLGLGLSLVSTLLWTAAASLL